MNAPEESDSGVLPMNHSNKIEQSMAEGEEGRPLIKENIHQSSTRPTQSGARVSQGLAGVRKAAREHKEMKFTALLHHVTVNLLRDSFGSLKPKAASGVDGMTWQEYEAGLEGRLADLHSRVHRGAYRALLSRRVYIEKGDGRKRPLGIAALEDKIVQRAVVTILNNIYEEDFLGFSYGFRPGRSQHKALDALSYALVKKKVNYVLDADIQGFFDNLDKAWMIKFVEHRVADQRILRLIQKWLKAGVMEDGKWSDTETGTPQGSGDLTASCQHLSPLCVRSMGGRLAQEVCARRGDRPPLCGRHRPRLPVGYGRRPFSQELGRTAGEVRTGAAPGKDAPDRVRAVCRTEPETKRRRQAGDLRLPWLHAYQREERERVLCRAAHDDPQAHAKEAAGDQAATKDAHA